MNRQWILVGAILGGAAVGLGALGAHWLEGYLQAWHVEDNTLIARRMDNWRTAATYQMHHALALVLVGLLGSIRPSRWFTIAGWCFLVGILFFAGLLYALVLSEIRVLGAIVPIGGVSFMLGWAALGLGGCCWSNVTSESNAGS